MPGTFVYNPASGTVPTGGTDTLSVTFTPTDSTDYATVTRTVSLVVSKANPVITWATPAAIAYGTALSGTQLDATASVPGTFVYSPAAGAVPALGPNTLTVTFTPTNTADYNGATHSVVLSVGKATPVITWATPTAIKYGTALSGTQLDATASVAGTFVYSPATGTVLAAGANTLSVTFTPTNTTDYTTATSSVALTVNKATPALTWATPAPVTYGTALSSIQLDASITIAPSMSISAISNVQSVPALVLSNAPLSPGTLQSCSTYYNQAPQTGQSLTFVIFNVNGNGSFTIVNTFTVTASPVSGLQTFTAPPIAVTAGQVVGYWAPSGMEPPYGGQSVGGYYINSEGTLPSGPQTFSSYGGGYPVSCVVQPSIVTSSATVSAPSRTQGEPDIVLSAAPLSAGTLQSCTTYYYAAPATGQSLTFLIFNSNGGGSYTIANSFTVTAAATAGLQTFTAPPIPITAGQVVGFWAASGSGPGAAGQSIGGYYLNNVTTLPTGPTTYIGFSSGFPVSCNVAAGTFAYTPAAGTVPAPGNDPLSVTFTPTNTTDFAPATATVNLPVGKVTPVLTWATPAPITYGTALSATQLNATASVPGTFVYNPAAGTVPIGGTDTLSVTFTPTNSTDYATVTSTVNLTVGKATPVITWPTPAAITYGTALSGTQLDATASVGGAFTYNPPAGAVPAAGSDILSTTFTPSDTRDYSSPSAEVTLSVVQQASTTTAISVFPTTTYVGNPVTVTVNVTDPQGTTPSGNINCSSTGTQQLTFSSPLSNGTARWTTPTLQIGSYSFSCNYLGTTGFTASASQPVAETVETVPQPTWTATGNMGTTVYLQTATLLPSGNVLIAGGNDNGYGDEGAVNTAEIYTPSAGSFASTGSMGDARFGHTATLLASGPNAGDVLIVGGENYADTELQEAELYNYQNGSGSFSVSSAQPNYPRSMHTATQLQDGTILVAGGYTGCVGCGQSNLAPAEIYNPVQPAFSKVGSLNTPRYAHTATLLQNGYVLIVGGFDNSEVTGTAELYNPLTQTFSPTGSLNTARTYHSATLLPNGNVLIAGGLNASGAPLNTAELYNPGTGEFSYTGQLNTARYAHGSSLVYSGNVLVYGGVATSAGATTVSAEQYNPQTGQFSATTSLNDARYFATSTLLPGDILLTTGGMNYSSGTYTQLSSAEIFSLNNSYITGFVNPKYVILGVTYAPPGPNSYVSYANTTTFGTTTAIGDQTSDQHGISTSLSETFAIPGLSFIGGQVTETGTDSSQDTQTSSSSTTVTLNKTMSLTNKTSGTGDAFNPVNHDYDIIWLWLNPLEIFTINAADPTDILWNGDGFDPTDGPGMDVYPVLLGNLNGDLPMDPSMQAELARGWANSNQAWPTGPGLTTQDYQQIAASDPFTGCTYNTSGNLWTNCPYVTNNLNAPFAPPTNSSDGRFTVYSGSQEIPYVQAGPGNGGGVTASYQNTVMNTQSVANGTSNVQQQSFSLETAFNITTNIPLNIFSNAISVKTTYTNTFTATQSYQQTISTTTTQQDTLSITGPGCPQTSAPCVPAYVGPPKFVVYQDNLFGSYMFYPQN